VKFESHLQSLHIKPVGKKRGTIGKKRKRGKEGRKSPCILPPLSCLGKRRAKKKTGKGERKKKEKKK